MELKAVISLIRSKLERYDSEAFCNVAICRAVLHSRVADVRHGLPETTYAVVGFGENIASVESEQKEEVELNRAFDGGA